MVEIVEMEEVGMAMKVEVVDEAVDLRRVDYKIEVGNSKKFVN